MPKHLTKLEKAQCKVILALLVTSLLLQRVGHKALDGEPDMDLPAVRECTNMIDEILSCVETDRRTIMIDKIQTARLRLTKRTAKYDIQYALVGSLYYMTNGQIKTKTGTRLDFIIQTFANNLDVMVKTIPEGNPQARAFEKEMGKVINAI